MGAGYEAFNNWYAVYPNCERFAPEDIEVTTGYVSDLLVAGQD